MKTGTGWRRPRRPGKGAARATRTLPPRLMRGQCQAAPGCRENSEKDGWILPREGWEDHAWRLTTA